MKTNLLRIALLVEVFNVSISARGVINTCTIPGLPGDNWPAKPIFSEIARVEDAVRDYHAQNCDWRPFTQAGAYLRGGNYLNFSRALWNPRLWDGMTNDPSGVILQTYDNGVTWIRQPVTMAQYALWLHSDYLNGGSLSPAFKANADALLALQRSDGGIVFNFDLLTWNPPLRSGWIAGLGQSLGISVWVRAYKLFNDQKYLDAARLASQCMLRPASQRGCLGSLDGLDPSLSRFPIVQEYPGEKDTYTWNDAAYAVIGLYDWSEYDPTVMCMVQKLTETLVHILPYYNVGGFSTYDLRHLTPGGTVKIDAAYHMYNTMLVWALDSISPDPSFNRTWRTWADTVSQPF